MTNNTTIKELQKMNPKDLLKEIAQQEANVVKLRLGVKLGKEKDSAKYIRARKQLARMKTVLTQKVIEGESPKKNEENASSEEKKSVSSRSKK